ncbi:hypothetical protein ACF0H5_018685 [Mactra antiquata]
MEVKTSLFVFVGIIASINSVSAGACYSFAGTGRVSFEDNIDISTKAHFKFEFKTIMDNAVLYYAEGTYHKERTYDYEGVFLSNGYLHYFLFNPGEYSIGSSFGFHGKTKNTVNDGHWHTVEFYRNREVQINDTDGKSRTVQQTGLELDGVIQAVDSRRREDVNIFQPIILGEDPHLAARSSKRIGHFMGKIRNFEELNSNHHFNREHEKKPGVTHCTNTPDVV